MLRVLSIDNEKEITDIIEKAFAAPPWNDRWTSEQLHTYFLDIAGNANSLILGFYQGDNLTGISAGRQKHWFDGIEYCIDDLCVDPKFQGRGAGSAFLAEIAEYAQRHAFKEVSLWTERSSGAYQFYKKNGWTESEEWVRFSIRTR